MIFARKIFYADGKPCVYCEDYFNKALLEDEADLDLLASYEESIFSFIYDKAGKKIMWDKVEISTRTNRDIPALNLYFGWEKHDIKSFLLLECMNFDDNDQPLVYAKEYVDTNYINFNSIRQKNGV